MNDWILRCNLQGYYDVIRAKEKINSLILENNLPNDVSGKSTTGEGSTQYALLNYSSNEVFEGLKNIIRALLIDNNKIKKEQNIRMLSAWTAVGVENTFHRIHRHNNVGLNHISTVAYLSISDNTPNKPGSFYAIVNNECMELNLNLGDLLIFPVWVIHGSYPQGGGIRQTLNMDFEVI